jgi:hypothetical protein
MRRFTKAFHLTVFLAVGIVLLGLASSPSAWAGSGQYQGGCGGTVPCRTPTSIPKEEKDKDTPASAPAQRTPAPTFNVMLTPSVLPQTLPGSGCEPSAFPLVLVATGVCLVYAGWMARRVRFM